MRSAFAAQIAEALCQLAPINSAISSIDWVKSHFPPDLEGENFWISNIEPCATAK